MAKIYKKRIADIRKEEIIHAFIKVMAEKGFSSATTREIAQAAGCSLGMLHHYFKNKNHMILESIDYTIAAYKSDFNNLISEHKTAEAQLRAFISCIFELDQFDMAWFKIFHEFRASAKDNSLFKEVIIKYYNQDKNFISDILKGGIASGEFKNIPLSNTIDMILGSVYGIVDLWFVTPETVSLKEMSRQLSDMLAIFLRR